MRSGRIEILIVVAAIAAMLGFPQKAEAITRIGGNFFAEETNARTPSNSVTLFQSGVNMDIVPPARKGIETRLGIRLNYLHTDEEAAFQYNINPFGNMRLNSRGEGYFLNLEHSRQAAVSTNAQLVETRSSRAALSLFPNEYPRLDASITRSEISTGGVRTSSDTTSFLSSYRYRWLDFRGGYTVDNRESSDGRTFDSSNGLLGLTGTYQIFPAVTLSGSYDFNRFDSESNIGDEFTIVGQVYRFTGTGVVTSWLNLVGNHIKDVSDIQSSTSPLPGTFKEDEDLTANLSPVSYVVLSASEGRRRFNDADQIRTVKFTTFSGSFDLGDKRLRHNIPLSVKVSRSFQYDPRQGRNISDTVGLSSVLEMTSRSDLRLNVTMNRNENRSFVSTQNFNASGTLADRSAFDDRPAGFTFFDVVNNNLYTKNSLTPGDWVLTAHIEPITRQYYVSKTIYVNATPTDKSTLALSYTSTSSSDRLDLFTGGSQVLNGTLTYQPNRKTSYGFTGTSSFSETRPTVYSMSGSMLFRSQKGVSLSLNYGKQFPIGTSSDSFTANVGIDLRKRSRLNISYTAAQMFSADQTSMVRVDFTKSF